MKFFFIPTFLFFLIFSCATNKKVPDGLVVPIEVTKIKNNEKKFAKKTFEVKKGSSQREGTIVNAYVHGNNLKKVGVFEFNGAHQRKITFYVNNDLFLFLESEETVFNRDPKERTGKPLKVIKTIHDYITLGPRYSIKKWQRVVQGELRTFKKKKKLKRKEKEVQDLIFFINGLMTKM